MRALERADFQNQYDKERKENADRMEYIACELIQQYNSFGEEEAYHALMHEVPALGDRTCLDLARSAGAIKFASKAAFESLTDLLWYGGIVGPSRRFLILGGLPMFTFPLISMKLEIVDLKEYFSLLVCGPKSRVFFAITIILIYTHRPPKVLKRVN